MRSRRLKDLIMELSANVSLGPGGIEDHPAPCGFGGIVMGLAENGSAAAHLHMIQDGQEREELTDAADSINKLDDASWESAFHLEGHENPLSGP